MFQHILILILGVDNHKVFNFAYYQLFVNKERKMNNIKTLEKNMMEVQKELKQTQQNEKIQQAYDFDENQKGSIINIQE